MQYDNTMNLGIIKQMHKYNTAFYIMTTFNFDATDKTDGAIRTYSADVHSCITNNHGYLVIFVFKQKYVSPSGISPQQQVADNTEIEK